MKLFINLLTVLLIMTAGFPAMAAPEVGQAAPDFSATDINGNAVSLGELKGHRIVLEWTNHECPFVMKHYDTGNMQKTQKAAADQNVTWISILSSAPGKQGNVSAEQAQKLLEEQGAMPAHKILDPEGTIGKLYDARTTPHMFVIDEQGVLVYAGAIDDNSSPRHDTVEGATNYVLAALSDLAAGRAVQTPQTQPYGCGVKY